MPSRPLPPKAPTSLDDARLAGQLLIAMPSMDDPRFTQCVIYLCAHTADGAMGLVLNRPVIRPSFADLMLQLDVCTAAPSRTINVCDGGPMDGARGFVLHTSDWTGDGSLQVDDAVALTASLDVLKAVSAGSGPRAALLALGYASWGAGQLDQEITANVWLSAPAPLDLVFDADHATKWRRAFASIRVDPAWLSGAAGHA